METSLSAMSGYQSRRLTLHHSLFQAATFHLKQHQRSWWSVIRRDSFTERASHTWLLQQPHVLTFELSVRKIRTDICSLIRRQLFVPEPLHVQSKQTAATGKGRTNKISWFNLPFMLLMSAAGILEGLFSCLRW